MAEYEAGLIANVLDAEIDDFDREIELARKNTELRAFLEARAKQTKTVSAAEARARLGLADE